MSVSIPYLRGRRGDGSGGRDGSRTLGGGGDGDQVLPREGGHHDFRERLLAMHGVLHVRGVRRVLGVIRVRLLGVVREVILGRRSLRVVRGKV